MADNKIIQLRYASKSAIVERDSTAAVADILKVARVRNARAGITGALALHNSRFAQILEGPEAEVNRLFDTISQDTRHLNVELQEIRTIDKQLFDGWSMALVGNEGEADLPLFASATGIVRAKRLNISPEQEAMLQALRTVVRV